MLCSFEILSIVHPLRLLTSLPDSVDSLPLYFFLLPANIFLWHAFLVISSAFSNLPQEFMAIFMITFCRSLCRWSYFVSWWYGTSNWAYYCRHWTAWGLPDHLLRFFAWLVEPFMTLFNAFVFVTVAQICFDVETLMF